jgi:gluconolactonase
MKFEVISDKVGFCEGPVFCQDGSIIVTSISDGCLYKTVNNQTTRFALLGGGPNGAVEAADGRIYVAQSGLYIDHPGGAFVTKDGVPRTSPAVQVVSPDGSFTDLQAGPVSPNDLAFGPDGYLYVSDPTRQPSRADGRLWRYDIASGQVEQIARMDWYCNGVAFSTETDCFYVADTRSGRILRFRLDDPRTEKAEVFIQMERNVPDGFAFDVEGNLICATVAEARDPGGAGCLQVWSKEGKHLDTIEVSGKPYVTNVAISAGGEMVVTDSTSGRLLRGQWHCGGLPLYPFR